LPTIFFYLTCDTILKLNLTFIRMTRFEELEKLVADLKDDFAKFYEKDNQAAGTRVRKGMQDLKDLAQVIRLEVQDIKNKQEAAKK
jgi:hypothetical protein